MCEHASTPEGHEDRELVLRITEVVPGTPAQPSITFGYHGAAFESVGQPFTSIVIRSICEERAVGCDTV
jgi:hypothetical protein